jgi:hypothetical protein
MGGGGGKGPVSNNTAELGQQNLANQLSSLLTQQSGESQQLFNLAFPGVNTAQNFYSALASGSPSLLAAATAPAAQQVQQATASAKQNILQNSPAGGERNLAISQADVAQGAQLGALASQGYTGSFNALAQLGGQGIGLGQSAAGAATGAGTAAGSQWSNIVQQNIQQKGATLGAIGGGLGSLASLGGSVFGAAGAAGGFGALFA